MNIKLMYFNKRVNSLKIPTLSSTEYVEYDGKIRNDCSLINPVISFNFGTVNNIPTYNYAKIDKFDRFYFINDWTFSDGLWVSTMSEDVLASYKDGLLRSSQYVLRSASEYNGYVVDTMYPITREMNGGRIPIASGSLKNTKTGTELPHYFDATGLADGYFVMSVVGENSTGITYFLMDYTGFKTCMNKIFGYSPSNFGDIGSGLAKQLANPSQYITSVLWFPDNPYGALSERSIKFGYYSVSVPCVIIGSSDNYEAVQTYSARFNVLNHPQASRGNYTNNLMRLTLIANPWGTFGLDTTQIAWTSDTVALEMRWAVDFTTGKSYMQLRGGEGEILVSTTGQIGVNVPIAGLSVDMLSTLGAAVGVATATASLLTGNVAGTIAGGSGAIASLSHALSPNPTAIGSQGSLISYAYDNPRIFWHCNYYAQDEPDKFGKPLCAYKRLDSLTGFCQCQDAKFYNSFALSDEIGEIEAYLNNGVYIE